MKPYLSIVIWWNIKIHIIIVNNLTKSIVTMTKTSKRLGNYWLIIMLNYSKYMIFDNYFIFSWPSIIAIIAKLLIFSFKYGHGAFIYYHKISTSFICLFEKC